MNPRLLVASCVCTAGLAACSSPDPYLENRLVLETSLEEVAAGEYAQAVHSLEAMLAQTETASRDFALQRFFAAYLLTRAHERAGALAPFLREPARTGGQFDLAGASDGATQPSRVGHLLAATYHSSFGRSWYDEAGESRLEVDGERLLPDELEHFGTPSALAYMNLCFLAVHAELNFQDRIEEVLAAMGELTDLERCEAIMDAVELSPAIRPWVYLGIFEHQKRRDEPNAYRFGIRARETGKDVPSFGAERGATIAHWITDESSYRFVSPANQEFDPALEGCTVSGTPNLMYEAILDTE